MKSYTTPTIIDRGAVSARALGDISTATLEVGATFRRFSNHPDAPDHDVGDEKTLEKQINGNLKSPVTVIPESIEDSN